MEVYYAVSGAIMAITILARTKKVIKSITNFNDKTVVEFEE